MRLVATVLCGALLIAGGCRRAPSEAERADTRAAQMRTALLGRLIPPQQQLLTTLERSPFRPGPIGVVVADVFAFQGAIERGAAAGADPLTHLTNLKSAQAEQWLRTPAGKRVFVAGAGSDGPTVWQFGELLKADGYVVFLYDFCQNLQSGLVECPAATASAYFQTAGHALVGTTETAVRSGLVREEAAGAPPLPAVERRAILITPTQAATIGEAAATDFAAVEIATRTPVPGGG
jgi:hypothetical protein